MLTTDAAYTISKYSCRCISWILNTPEYLIPRKNFTTDGQKCQLLQSSTLDKQATCYTNCLRNSRSASRYFTKSDEPASISLDDTIIGPITAQFNWSACNFRIARNRRAAHGAWSSIEIIWRRNGPQLSADHVGMVLTSKTFIVPHLTDRLASDTIVIQWTWAIKDKLSSPLTWEQMSADIQRPVYSEHPLDQLRLIKQLSRVNAIYRLAQSVGCIKRVQFSQSSIEPFAQPFAVSTHEQLVGSTPVNSPEQSTNQPRRPAGVPRLRHYCWSLEY